MSPHSLSPNVDRGRRVESIKRVVRRTAPSADYADKEHESTGPETVNGLFVCPWPNCNKTFERVKSRSAHLKWHGLQNWDRLHAFDDRMRNVLLLARVVTDPL